MFVHMCIHMPVHTCAWCVHTHVPLHTTHQLCVNICLMCMEVSDSLTAYVCMQIHILTCLHVDICIKAVVIQLCAHMALCSYDVSSYLCIHEGVHALLPAVSSRAKMAV